MNNLILVRHGQSLWNREKRFTGWADIDLTEKGKLDGKEIAELLAKKYTNMSLFCSNAIRTINTSNYKGCVSAAKECLLKIVKKQKYD